MLLRLQGGCGELFQRFGDYQRCIDYHGDYHDDYQDDYQGDFDPVTRSHTVLVLLPSGEVLNVKAYADDTPEVFRQRVLDALPPGGADPPRTSSVGHEAVGASSVGQEAEGAGADEGTGEGAGAFAFASVLPFGSPAF
ncbi:hypothetical protein FOA52_002919 [Chlamydomonas sp. UWO 241]|nr:hypothetical protein FOA52_002919 [Chlamydomonas sp. UWO 241]